MMDVAATETVVDIGAFERWLTASPHAWTGGGAEDACDALTAHLTRHYGDPNDTILSFDVFDTLLLRTDTPEEERFQIAAADVAPKLPMGTAAAEDIFLARYRAHMMAYRVVPHRDGVPEASLRDVVSGMLALLDASPDVAPIIEAAELEFERTQLRANPFLARFLERRTASGPVLLVSDMYLSHAHISALVRQSFPDLDFTLYVSNDVQLSKRNGTLFDYVCAQENLAPEAILHFGDNFRSDVVQAKARGLRALHLPVPEDIERARAGAKKAFLDAFEAENGFRLEGLQ